MIKLVLTGLIIYIILDHAGFLSHLSATSLTPSSLDVT